MAAVEINVERDIFASDASKIEVLEPLNFSEIHFVNLMASSPNINKIIMSLQKRAVINIPEPHVFMAFGMWSKLPVILKIQKTKPRMMIDQYKRYVVLLGHDDHAAATVLNA